MVMRSQARSRRGANNPIGAHLHATEDLELAHITVVCFVELAKGNTLHNGRVGQFQQHELLQRIAMGGGSGTTSEQ